MGAKQRIWLVNNEASGSNDAAALATFEGECDECGFAIAHRTVFPQQELPTPRLLDAAEVDLLAIFAGDGTINAALESVEGWGGAVLILPGGTMNLLYHRLFGDAELNDVLAAVACGDAKRQRPGIVESDCGRAYAGVLAGPGTAWADVREAMRWNAPLEMAADAREAIAETLYGNMLRVQEPELGKDEGYPLVLLTPRQGTIECDAYYAETAAEYLDQALALIRRQFRKGPHEQLGTGSQFVLASVDGGGFGVLLDGEPCSVDNPTQFRLVECPVDLLATRTDD